MSDETYQQDDSKENPNKTKDESTEKPYKTNLQYIGDGIKTILYWVKITVIGIVPLSILLAIAFLGVLDVFGFEPFGTRLGDFFNISFWFIMLSLVPGTIVAYLLYRTDDRDLFATNVANGGVGGGFELSERDWSDLDVYLYDSEAPRYMGEKTNTSALNFNGNFYEAIAYYKDENVAVLINCSQYRGYKYTGRTDENSSGRLRERPPENCNNSPRTVRGFFYMRL
ncbi:hypothetical protein [Halostagnicola sp. A56]|uniref:hypothetical protein n=1 Tax=Halostagnicola sp. A56 TaxID=1495067 RepID=UPI000678DE92|nr:hypothetical protein [Halostagnicola sp. A56]